MSDGNPEDSWPEVLRDRLESYLRGGAPRSGKRPQNFQDVPIEEADEATRRPAASLALKGLIDQLRTPPPPEDGAKVAAWRIEIRRAFQVFHYGAYQSDEEIGGDWPSWVAPGDVIDLDPNVLDESDRNRKDYIETTRLLTHAVALRPRLTPPYSLLFPVVIPDITQGKKKGYLFRAEVTVLSPAVRIGHEPRVDLAPWSFYWLKAKDLQALRDSLKKIAESGHPEALTALRGRDILLALEPVEQSPPPLSQRHRCRIGGESLGLAVVLSAWAAGKRPMFRRMALTGKAGSRAIEEIDDVKDKFKAVRDYADSIVLEMRGQNFWFLVAEDSPEANDYRGVRDNVVVELVKDWTHLFDEIIPKLLTDGFDHYREAFSELPPALTPRTITDAIEVEKFGDYTKADVASLDDWAATIAAGFQGTQEGKRSPIFQSHLLPFANDPEIAAQRVAARLIAKLSAGHAFETPVPVPLLLGGKDWSPREAIARGVQDLGKILKPRPAGFPTVEHVRDAATRFPGMFLLIVYGWKSASTKLPTPGKNKAIRALREWARSGPAGVRPHICFIASDWHHRAALGPALEEITRIGKPDDPPGQS